ncbi:probable disease resistance protein At1g52660 isoform X2 [Trifolium pratense]|uniref:probable disease resistance protein At1g52660 isoform X2 n=1 Tax=Trifolium pratense TaxID=57577 RepID=UPI001E6933C6|nr:probable disease resistance protein At1g52660 isoform X2 [Trifolium pratense]
MAGNINFNLLIRQGAPIIGRAVRMVAAVDWSGKVLKEVKRENNNLILNRDFVLRKVNATDHKTQMINDVVFEWLEKSEILIQEVENLRIEERSPLWNDFKELLEKITALNAKCEFEPFSTPIPSLEHFSSGNIVCFNSREKTSDQLLVALKDDSCSMIGLYGRQGSGKTTLVKAMGEKVKYLKIFQEVLFARASQNNIRRMQDEIADLLNLKFDKNSDAGRARRISSTIDSMNCPILVIFDDVRVKFDLEDVGIPYNSNRCKVLLTTCSQQDCDLMHTQKDIQLGPLSTEESWTLFQKHSGIHDEKYSASFDLLNVAREVAIECEGLPGTIKDAGSSLRSKPIEEWKTTLDSLKHSMAKWQIFLSFRGEDTRHTFTGSLYQALSQGRFKTFMDDGGGLDIGDQISPSLLNAIEASRLSIIVLSENYANSTWCLDELVKILECKKLKNQEVWPIFYKVKPSDIRHMRESYGKDMSRHENTFGINSERVQKWKSALSEVCKISGKHYTDGYEYEFINTIVEDANRIRSRLQIQNRYVLE